MDIIDDFNIFVFGPYKEMYFAFATHHRAFTADEIKFHINRLHEKLVWADEILISLNLCTVTENAHIVIIQSVIRDISRAEIPQTIYDILEHCNKPTMKYCFYRVKYDKYLPIEHCTVYSPELWGTLEAIKRKMHELYEEFPRCEIQTVTSVDY